MSVGAKVESQGLAPGLLAPSGGEEDGEKNWCRVGGSGDLLGHIPSKHLSGMEAEMAGK